MLRHAAKIRGDLMLMDLKQNLSEMKRRLADLRDAL